MLSVWPMKCLLNVFSNALFVPALPLSLPAPSPPAPSPSLTSPHPVSHATPSDLIFLPSSLPFPLPLSSIMGWAAKFDQQFFLKVTEPSKESQPKCWGEWGRDGRDCGREGKKARERDKRPTEWRMQGGEGRRAEGKAAGESSAVMEERNGAMEGKEKGGRWGNLLFCDMSDLVTDEFILNM